MPHWQCSFCQTYWAYYTDNEDYDRKVLKHIREVHPREWEKLKKYNVRW